MIEKVTSAGPGRLTGMTAFVVIWLSQVASVLSTLMTQFGITIWAYQKTGSATALAMTSVFLVTPQLILTPLAGVMVDRYNRKLMMALSDLGAGTATVGLLALHALGRLEIGHIYAAAAITGAFQTFQWPAYSVAISLMLPKEQYARANGMMTLIEAGPGVLAPLLAGALLGLIHLTGIMLIDIVTFIIAVGILLVVHIPQPPAEERSEQHILRELGYGFRYIWARPSLLGLQLISLGGNLFAGLGFTVLAPMILARTGSNQLILGAVQSAGAIGAVAGGVLMSAWGGWKRRVHGVLLGLILSSLLGQVVLGLGRDVRVWGPAILICMLFLPIMNSSNQAIWQAKVPPAVQGRVFSTRLLIAWLATPLAALVAGPLSDRVLEPAMQTESSLAAAWGWLVGAGPGAGMALLFTLSGVLAAMVGLSGYLIPVVREAETRLPDHAANV